MAMGDRIHPGHKAEDTKTTTKGAAPRAAAADSGRGPKPSEGAAKPDIEKAALTDAPSS